MNQKRILVLGSLFLILAMVLSLLPVGGTYVFAETLEGGNEQSQISHLFLDYDYQEPITGSAITIYGNGAALKVGDVTINNKQAVLYTDISASYQYATNNKGKFTSAMGNVIVGITSSDKEPALTKNKIVDAKAAQLAKAAIKSGQITVTATGKAGGTAYLWVVDTGGENVKACIPITVKMAPKKIELQSQNGSKLTNPSVKVGESITVQAVGIVSGTTKTSDCTYTATVDSKYQSYIKVAPVEGTDDQFVITGTGLNSGKATKTSVMFTCNQNGKNVNVSLTVNP